MDAGLELVPGDRPRPSAPGLAHRQKRYAPWLSEPLTQWHFAIDGEPLALLISALGEDATLGEDVSVADGAWADLSLPLVQSLRVGRLTDPDWSSGLQPGRFPLYVCSECADLGCGALTVAIERTARPDGEAVVWSDFRFEDGFTVSSELPSLTGLGRFTFSAEHYHMAFQEPLEQLGAMADRLTAAERAWRAQRSPAARARRLIGRARGSH